VVRVVLTEEHIEVRLAVWEKILGLLGNIRVARTAIDEAHMVEDPLGVAMSAGIKVGLRLPWLCYVARTIRLDQAFIVRRGLPGISFAVADGGRLARVLVSTPDAQELARSLAQS
jgi:hypothetical protein